MKDAPHLSGLRVLITGGSSGIGLSVAEQLAARGARPAILARGESAVREAARRTGALALTADVTDLPGLTRAVEQAARELDGLAPNLTQVPLGTVARLGWRARHRRPASPEDGLARPAARAERSGGLATRRSLLQLARGGVTRSRR